MGRHPSSSSHVSTSSWIRRECLNQSNQVPLIAVERLGEPGSRQMAGRDIRLMFVFVMLPPADTSAPAFSLPPRVSC